MDYFRNDERKKSATQGDALLFGVLTVDLGELIMQSDQPAAYVGADEDGDDEVDMSEHEDVADAEDELVVELCEDENVSPITDGNDSDYSV